MALRRGLCGRLLAAQVRYTVGAPASSPPDCWPWCWPAPCAATQRTSAPLQGTCWSGHADLMSAVGQCRRGLPWVLPPYGPSCPSLESCQAQQDRRLLASSAQPQPARAHRELSLLLATCTQHSWLESGQVAASMPAAVPAAHFRGPESDALCVQAYCGGAAHAASPAAGSTVGPRPAAGPAPGQVGSLAFLRHMQTWAPRAAAACLTECCSCWPSARQWKVWRCTSCGCHSCHTLAG